MELAKRYKLMQHVWPNRLRPRSEYPTDFVVNEPSGTELADVRDV
jgi:hypothetical protein